MKVGYARVSTTDQNLNLQIDALEKEGCEKIYQEKISGAKMDRPEFNKMGETLRKGDVVVVYKLDRLGRSLRHLVETIADFQEKGVGFKSINDPIDTTTSQGRLIFNIFASLAEFERDLIRERTQAGLTSARARGRLGGRPKGLSEEAQQTARVCESLYQEGELSANAIARQLGISKATLYKYLRHRGVEVASFRKNR
jgi:DNA invertase Pin-like site-specific DNA recombinase